MSKLSKFVKLKGFLPYMELSAVELSREQTSELGGQILITKNALPES